MRDPYSLKRDQRYRSLDTGRIGRIESVTDFPNKVMVLLRIDGTSVYMSSQDLFADYSQVSNEAIT